MTGSQSKVYVIGGGLAGLSAAFEVLNGGARAVLVEKATIGGNSAKATSGINAVHSKFQKARADIDDSVDLFLNDTLKSGQGLCVKSLSQVLVALSGEAVDALDADFSLTLSEIEMLGGHSRSRTHRFKPVDGRVAPVGYTVTSTLGKRYTKEVEEGRADLLTNTRLVDFELTQVGDTTQISKLVLENSDGTRTDVTDFSAVIFSAGGYAADSGEQSILGKHRPDLIGFPTTNGPFAEGDLVKLGIQKGLKTIHLDKVQLHPTGFVDPKAPTDPRKFLCPEVIRGLGAILVDTSGNRFTNELLPRDQVSAAILKHGASAEAWRMAAHEGNGRQKIALLLMTHDTAKRFGASAFGFYVSKGFIFDLSDGAAFKKAAPTIDLENLLSTLKAYDLSASGQSDDPFGKTAFPGDFGTLTHHSVDALSGLYGAFITPSLHYTMGGLAIAEDARAVLEGTDERVVNLFVAGENAGGVHGENRLGGNGCLESLVFGRLAGRLSARIPVSISEDSLKEIEPSGSHTVEVLAAEAEGDSFNLAIAMPASALRWGNASIKSLKVIGKSEPHTWTQFNEKLQGHYGYSTLKIELADNPQITTVLPGDRVEISF